MIENIFAHTITLEDERVLLRPLMQEDFNHLLPFAINEPTIWKYSLVSAAGEQGMKNYIESAVRSCDNKTEYPFIVWDKQTNEYSKTHSSSFS